MTREQITERLFSEGIPTMTEELKDITLSSIKSLNKDENLKDLFPAISYKTISIGGRDYKVKLEIEIF